MNAPASIAPPAEAGLSSKTRALVALAAGQAARSPAWVAAQSARARAAGATPREIAEAAAVAASLDAEDDALPLWEEG
ncbi:carboxymuconolactone decarboxylase family protein [Roseomonas sp. 18066]|uniref:carboxymuconolactone decarboxylase family protein n=1 Tax=Roseomonas sp. 18066 TaxID=2681412 RepID=UPI00135B3718|nr:carboxymuconolactone decarboxylase family protein [Roseomonas sp. 18066]